MTEILGHSFIQNVRKSLLCKQKEYTEFHNVKPACCTEKINPFIKYLITTCGLDEHNSVQPTQTPMN